MTTGKREMVGDAMSEMPPVDELLGWVRAADDRMEGAIGSLDGRAVAEPSLLPGWTRGHVLCHLARNADGLTNLLTWARTGVETPMYPSREARNAGIEAGAGRAIDEQREDLAAASARFLDAVRTMPSERWAAHVSTASSGPVPASDVPWMRAREMWVHLVDLDAGVTPDDWPDEVTARVLAEAALSIGPRVEEPVTLVVDGDDGAPIVLGGAAGEAAPQARVRGTRSDVLAWLIGRSPGTGLAVTGASTLPRLPAWI